MKEDTTLHYGDTLTDAAYQSFYWGQDSANTGKFVNVRVLSSDSATFGAAAILNALVLDDIALETHLKSVNNYYLSILDVGDSLDGADSSAVLDIATLPYFTGGEATYYAIGMLGLELTPSIPELRIGIVGETITAKPIPQAVYLTDIYPNPASDYFYVKSDSIAVKKLEIYDAKIKLLKTIEMNIVGNPIPIPCIPGIYGIKLYLENGEIKWCKLVKI